MRKAEVTRTRPGLVTLGLFLLAATSAGCSDGESGSVASTPRIAPDAVQASPSTKGTPAPKVPRGPGQAKSLQEAKTK